MSRPPVPLHLVGPVRARWSGAADGDLRPGGGTPPGRAALTEWAGSVIGATTTTGTGTDDGDRPPVVAWVRQVHGAGVLSVPEPADGVVGRPGAALAGTADALVTTASGPALAVLTADCAPVALGSPEGVHGAVHAGWRGLVAGVIPAAVAAMQEAGATRVVAALGPCIHAECYEFAEEDLAEVARVLGPAVRSRTTDGRPALDIPAAVSASLAAAGAEEVPGVDRCTACGGGCFSHRARADAGRQALLVWSTGPAAPAGPGPVGR